MNRAGHIPLAKRASWKRRCLAKALIRWRPISLTWRRASRAVEAHIAGAGGAVTRHNWSPRFNLHLHLAFTTYARRSHWSTRWTIGAPAPRRSSQTHFTSFHMIGRWSLTTEVRRLATHGVRDVRSNERPPGRYAHANVGKFVPVWNQSTPVRSIRSANSSPIAPSRVQALGAIEAISGSRLSRTMSRSGHRTMRLAWRALAEPGSVARLHSLAPAALRGPELVWRTESQSGMLDAVERSTALGHSAIDPSGAVRTPQLEPSLAPVGALPIRTLDPALIDRVADDVMGRVERRIRIERERRGV